MKDKETNWLKKRYKLFYTFVFIFWTLFLCVLGVSFWVGFSSIKEIYNTDTTKAVIITILLALNFVCVIFTTFSGTRDALMQVMFLLVRRKVIAFHKKILETELPENPKVVLIYCCCNDFDKNALSISMKQDYDNCEFVILDDSNKPEKREEVDNFAKENNIKVIRRDNRKGFKAGALNNYLKNYKDEYDFVGILDADEILCPNFTKDTLKYFYFDKEIGVVQVAHKATKSENIFQELMGMGIKSDSLIFSSARSLYGFSQLFGHGMMVSAKALETVDYFSEFVCEDFALSLKFHESGIKVVQSPIIICQEEYPSNFITAKKRQLRWIEGDVEIQKRMKNIYKSKRLPALLRLDFQITQFQNYKTILFLLATTVITLTLMLLGFNILKLWPVYLFTTILTAIPLLKDFCVYFPTRDWWRLLFYLVLNMLVYTSLYPSMIFRIICAELGKKPFFNITKKGSQKVLALEIIKHSIAPILFATCIGIVTWITYHSVTPTLTIIIAGLLAPCFILLSNIKKKNKTISEKRIKKLRKQVKKNKEKELSQEITIA